jgi:5-methylcytosine-specific restriction protein B
MNDSIEERQTIWDRFLQRWPHEALGQMTLEQYTQSGGKDCFVYWLEVLTEKLGSMWGGSAFKFGIYSRKDQTVKPSEGGLFNPPQQQLMANPVQTGRCARPANS